jgi:hypothetical protein
MATDFSIARVLLILVCVSQAALADTEGAMYPRLQNLHDSQQEALQYEQRSYEALLPPPASSANQRPRLPNELRRQTIQLRQLQHLQRLRAITEQQRALSQPDRSPRENAASQLNRFSQQQESERLHFKIQRRSWPTR